MMSYHIHIGESQEVTARDHTQGERTYDYPKVKPDDSTIQVRLNEAYATNIISEKNEAYKLVTSPNETVDEYYVYEYI